MTKADFQKLAEMRIKEVSTLIAAGDWDWAYYTAGYCIECALKACIIKRLNTSDAWPERKFSDECYKHDLNGLLKVAQLEGALAWPLRWQRNG